MEVNEQDVYEIIADKMDKTPGKLEDILDKPLSELGLDSLDIAEIQIDLETKYDIVFNDEEFREKYGKKPPVSSLIDYLRNYSGKQKQEAK